jgi:hypothetical protein
MLQMSRSEKVSKSFDYPRSPNLNAFTERFVRSIKEESLSRMIFFGSAPLQHVVRQYMMDYHTERNEPFEIVNFKTGNEMEEV